MSYPICRDLQRPGPVLRRRALPRCDDRNLSTGGEHKPAAAEIVSGTYFSVLGVSPALGRVLTNDDDETPGASPVVVLSYDFWKTQLAGAPDVVGRKVLVNQHPMTVVGVAAADVPRHRRGRGSRRSGFPRHVGAGHSRVRRHA